MTSGGEPGRRTALVLTCSDRSAAGTRPDASGEGLQARLEALAFTVVRAVVPDDRAAIGAALVEARRRAPAHRHDRGHRPHAARRDPPGDGRRHRLRGPGLAEAMRAEGRRSTPFAALSRGVVGVRGGSLIVNLPGSPNGALESFEASSRCSTTRSRRCAARSTTPRPGRRAASTSRPGQPEEG